MAPRVVLGLITMNRTAVLTYDSEVGFHILITRHQDDKIRAECTCKQVVGPWRSNGPENYAVVKADHADAHAGGGS